MERQFVEYGVGALPGDRLRGEERRGTEVGELSCYLRTHSQGPVGRASQVINHCIIPPVCVCSFL